MTEQELARALIGRTPQDVLARWLAVEEMTSTMGVQALTLDHEVETALNNRKLEIALILAPHMKAEARSWSELHDALSEEEHDQLEALLKGT